MGDSEIKIVVQRKNCFLTMKLLFTKVKQKRNAAQKMKGDLQKNTKQASFLFGENKAQ